VKWCDIKTCVPLHHDRDEMTGVHKTNTCHAAKIFLLKQDASCCYWPEKKGASVTYGKLKVTVVSEDNHGDVVIRKLKVTGDKPGTVAPHVRAEIQLS